MPKLSQNAFSDVALRKLKPMTTRKDYYDAVQRGLGIRVAPSGTKTWFAMRRIDGRMKRVNIGRYPEIGLADARKKAAEILSAIAVGKAPIARQAPTFQALMEEWFIRDQSGRRGAHEKRRALLRDAVPRLGRMRIDTITRSDIRILLDSIVDRGAPVHANRLLAYLRRMFNWAVERDLIASSPAAGIKPPAPEASRDRTLSAEELARVWKGTASLDAPFDAYFRMLILTGQRRNEVASARWSEFDLARREWTIPSERAKNGSAHVVHLSPMAVDILTGVPRLSDELVFTTTGRTSISGFSKAKANLDAASGVTGWTIHDLRRTFATIGTGDLGIDPVVMDKILNHRSGVVKGVAAVYQRAAYMEHRRQALEKWSDYIGSLSTA